MIIRVVFLLSVILVCTPSYAKTMCEATSVNNIYVEAERPSDPKYSNTLLIKLDASCAGKGYAYIENSAKAYDGILSMTLMAYASGKKLVIAVDEQTFVGNASRIEYLYPQ